MPKFTVDTQLFRELGELLVGRDSTALVELVKNSYDADATQVMVFGAGLDTPENGRITITDNGVGMNSNQFTEGFLRVASRMRNQGDARSVKFGRRYTGAKGIGRLAAHKLARHITVESVPWAYQSKVVEPIVASIDWDKVEAHRDLDELVDSDAIQLTTTDSTSSPISGTTITLSNLRKRWTPGERTRFFTEVTSFTPPEQLIKVPKGIINGGLLLNNLKLRDAKRKDPGFTIQLEGDFNVGEEYWVALARTADWMLEIDASKPQAQAGKAKVQYRISPTRKYIAKVPDAENRDYAIDHPCPEKGPFFQARILIREGRLEEEANVDKGWLTRSCGVRVFMEGFRVLPYGEEGNDWLGLDYDYTRRNRALDYLGDLPVGEPSDENEGLIRLRNSHYYGAVLLTVEDAPGLRMLVNREGFVPEAPYEILHKLVRTGIDLSTRVRALYSKDRREQRSIERKDKMVEVELRRALKEQVEVAVERASKLAHEARQQAVAGDFDSAAQYISKAADEFAMASETSERLMTERTMMQVLASVGLQMAAFVHEVNALLGMANTLELSIKHILENEPLPSSAQGKLRQLIISAGDLRRILERQASYLVDVVSPDARRRRSRQKLGERFDASRRLVETSAARREIEIVNDIPSDLRTPPMFTAEITLVFTNLLTNAVKAAGQSGRIWVHAVRIGKAVSLRIENTGLAVSPTEGERWFRPLESTTTEVDPILGQGMGMGLPITRNILSEYGVIVRFVEPSFGYTTAVELTFEE